MNINRELRLSKAMCYVLRHKPEDIGIELDRDGQAKIEDLIVGLVENNTKFEGIRIDDIIYIVETDEKKRYKTDGRKIRAVMGIL